LKPLPDDRDGTNASPFGGEAGPQHGGRASPSSSDAGKYGCGPLSRENPGEFRETPWLVSAVNPADRRELNDLDGRRYPTKFSTEQGRHFVAAEHPVPDFDEPGADEIRQRWRRRNTGDTSAPRRRDN